MIIGQLLDLRVFIAEGTGWTFFNLKQFKVNLQRIVNQELTDQGFTFS